MTKPEGRRRPVVQSVARTLALIEAVAAEDELGLVELADRTGLQPSTAHRLLSTLIECGYVVQSARTSRYRLSYKVIRLSGSAEQRIERLRGVVRPHLTAIRDSSDETANLVVLDRFTTVYVDQVASPRSVRMHTEIGTSVAAHATAGGKAMLAFLPDSAVEDLTARPLEALTPRTVTTPDAFRAELERARERGYAVDDEESEEGVVSIAAPVFGHDGIVHAAGALAGPAGRMHGRDVDELGKLVAARMLEASAELGYES
jgi:IclR family acetate operon transcriptional repressor